MQSTATTNVTVASARRARTLVLAAAVASFLFSIGLWFSGSRDEGLFVGLWVPSILALGAFVLPPTRTPQ